MTETRCPRCPRPHHLCGFGDALRGIHRPADRRDADGRVAAEVGRGVRAAGDPGAAQAGGHCVLGHPAARRPDGLLAEFDARLPFELTIGQELAGATIADELALDHPMHRLLQGEVGSGKTVIAVRAMLQVVDGGGQAVLLAPTEVLAQQHYRSISALLGPLGQAGQLGGAEQATGLALLTGSLGAAARRKALLDAASGAPGS